MSKATELLSRVTYRRVQRSLYSGLLLFFLISVFLHSIPFWGKIEIPEKEVKVKKKPLSVKFIQKAPRLVKPLELMKKPKVVTKRFERKMPTKRNIVPRSMRTATLHGGTALASLARPSDPIDRSLSLIPEKLELGPVIEPEEVVATKESKVQSLTEELLDVSDLNYGKYSAIAIQNPNNKKDVKGFMTFRKIMYTSKGSGKMGQRGGTNWDPFPQAIPNLRDFIQNNTGVDFEIKGSIRLDSPDLHKLPFIYMPGQDAGLRLSNAEFANLRDYIFNGGFVFFDNLQGCNITPFAKSVYELVSKLIEGKATIEPIPETHRIYHCFYDFDFGPPDGFDLETSIQTGWSNNPCLGVEPTPYLEGVFIEGRLAVVISNKSYGIVMGLDDRLYTEGSHSTHTNYWSNRQSLMPSYKMMTNAVIFALTEPGGIAQKQARFAYQ